MTKFLNYIQNSYNYTDYQIKVIRYFFICMASDFSKLFIILGFSVIIERLIPCLVSLCALLFLRISGGGFHCEHYITCLLFSFSFTFLSIFLAENIPVTQTAIIINMIICVLVAFMMVPIVSYHRPKPSDELIKKSRIINFSFLILYSLAVSVFYENYYLLIIFWVTILHSIQLLLPLLNKKGGKYHVRIFHKSCT